MDGIAIRDPKPVKVAQMVTLKSVSFMRATAVDSKAQVLVVSGVMVSNINPTVSPVSVVLKFTFSLAAGGSFAPAGNATITVEKPVFGAETRFSGLTDWPITQGEGPIAYSLAMEIGHFQPPKLGR